MPNNEKQKLVLILGSGFSKAFGLPTTDELSNMFFNSLTDKRGATPRDLFITNSLKQYFKKIYGYTTDYHPSLEDHFTMLDLAANTGHNLGKEYPAKKLRAIRRFSIHRIFELINRDIIDPESMEPAFGKFFPILRKKYNCSVITINWDIIVEKLLQDGNYDYTIDTESINDYGLNSTTGTKTNLLKVHGSANWLYCDTCRKIYAGPSKSALDYAAYLEKDDFNLDLIPDYSHIINNYIESNTVNGERCKYCKNKLGARLATFSYRKDLSIIQFQTIWHNARKVLSEADIWLFIGYSLPEADYEFKQLLKTSQLAYQNPDNKKMYVVLKEDIKAKNRYFSLFGNIPICQNGLVEWCKYSTDAFVVSFREANP